MTHTTVKQDNMAKFQNCRKPVLGVGREGWRWRDKPLGFSPIQKQDMIGNEYFQTQRVKYSEDRIEKTYLHTCRFTPKLCVTQIPI